MRRENIREGEAREKMPRGWKGLLAREDTEGWSFRNEIIAAFVNFLAAGYIVAVNPDILSQAGMPRESLISATAYATALGCFLMALWAKVPVILAPGMGLNAFFAYTLCLRDGIPWQVALGIVFISGVLFIALSYWGLREKVLYMIPKSLRVGILVGIGLFISFIGFHNMGLVTASPATLVTLGAITPKVAAGVLGLFAAIALEYYRIPGSLLIAILAVTLAAVGFGWVHPPETWLSPPPSVAPVAFKLDVIAALKPVYWVPIFVFLYLALFDTLGSLTAVAYQAGFNRGDEIPGLRRMFMADATGAVLGAVLGTSTVTAYIESCAGIASGGRTGWTALFTGVLFLLAPLFAGFIAIVPPYATAIALVIVGVYMMKHVSEIDFTKWEEAVPAFFTIALMPLSYSIATGICFGVLSYIAVLLISRRFGGITPILWIMGAVSLFYLFVESH
jgi:AGZA family xanthine/uracil permease-like MFS transporter